MESVEVSAKTVEEAVEQALARLGKTRDEVDVTVLSEGHRRILGFMRGENARVRVTVLGSTGTGRSASPAAAKPRAASTRTPKSKPAAVAEPAAPPRIEGAAVVAKDATEELLENMGIYADVIYRGGSGDEKAPILLEVQGEDLGILIGRRGETLSSLQFLLNLIVGKRLDSWVRVVIDVEGYRARREESLRALAGRVADRVRRSGQPVTLEPMPANERRIVHLSLQESPHVTTESSGYGDERRVTVYPKARP